MLHQMMKRGRYISRFPIVKYLNDFGIQCVLDVGANTGQFAQEIRWLGYSGRIESFEPIPSVFEKLRESANGDSQWGVHPFALGDRRETKQINVSANTPSSSFLELDSNVANAPVDLSTVGSVDVEIRTLDEVFETVTLIQTKKIENFPIILMGTEFWTPMIDFLKTRMIAA
ncbi:MAG: FkbM family methyltransferase, partial [Pirellula sp.]